MKKGLILFLLFTMVGVACMVQVTSTASLSNDTLSYQINFRCNLVPAANEYDFEDTLTIYRTSTHKVTQLLVPPGGSFTNIILNQTPTSQYAETEGLLTAGGAMDEGPFALDITQLPQGDYYIHIGACHIWGLIFLELRD